MSGYWWGILTLPLVLGLLAAGVSALSCACWLFSRIANVRLLRLQPGRGRVRDRAEEVGYIAAAPRAWALDIGGYLGITVSCGRADSGRRRRVVKAVQDLDRVSLAEILRTSPPSGQEAEHG